MQRKQGSSIMLLFMYAMLIVALMVLAVAGARLYASTVSAREANTASRSALAFIQSQTMAFEGGGRITLEDGPEGSVLCLAEPDGSYVTRIYQYENALRMQVTTPEMGLMPAFSERICQISEFHVTLEQGGLLRILADGREGVVYCAGGVPNA